MRHESFDFSDSDITLQADDGILFRVHKANLCAHSVTLKDTFEVGSAADEPITLQEDAVTLAIVLSMCYPAAEAPVELDELGVQQVLAAYGACCKYQMWVSSKLLRKILLSVFSFSARRASSAELQRPIAAEDPFRFATTAYDTDDRQLLDLAVRYTSQHDLLDEAKGYRQQAGALWILLVRVMRS